ncbi:YgeY family selenium metabolism-linked hydrolase [Desulfosporosinus sp. SB140]|uniref:YgeY family selenium metabolism-linked hydrolase n=1 Tax=Desulfosporosinus paludis TaxID=3115649 RepID=UPI00388DA871
MKEKVQELVDSLEEKLVYFASDLVKIKSKTGEEEAVVKRIAEEMKTLKYDKVYIDRVGNVIGKIGNGNEKLLYDSHIDNVAVNDPESWEDNPYGGIIKDGKLYGRGASDMKASAAASIYAGAVMKKLGLAEGKTIYICCSVMEEDYDGEGLYHAIVDNDLRPDYVVICEPTHLQISLGHLGRAIYKINIPGVSAHGAAPEKGINAVYKMTTIINRVKALGKEFMKLTGEHPSIALTKIESSSVSLNAIPQSCSIYIDRRMTLEENEETVGAEMNKLIEGTDATWEIYDAIGTSWKGEEIILHSFLPAWEIKEDHKLTKGCVNTYEELIGKKPVMYKWNFSTNGVASASKLGIPTIGFGAGIEKMAHMTNEYCPISDISAACKFYSLFPYFL